MVIHWFVGCMMPELTITVVPNGGYDREKFGSFKERIWLSYLDMLPIKSRYCSGGGQHRIGQFYLDGYRVLPNGSRECYEFMVVIIMVVQFVTPTDLRW